MYLNSQHTIFLEIVMYTVLQQAHHLFTGRSQRSPRKNSSCPYTPRSKQLKELKMNRIEFV